MQAILATSFGQKDSHKSLFDVWKEIFALPRPNRLSVTCCINTYMLCGVIFHIKHILNSVWHVWLILLPVGHVCVPVVCCVKWFGLCHFHLDRCTPETTLYTFYSCFLIFKCCFRWWARSHGCVHISWPLLVRVDWRILGWSVLFKDTIQWQCSVHVYCVLWWCEQVLLASRTLEQCAILWW